MSERERLLGRRLPPATYTLRVDYTPEADEAQAELEAARAALHDARVRGLELADLRARVDAAEVAYAPHSMALRVRPIAADAYEELELAHPPTAMDTERGYSWNVATYIPELLAACVEGDITAEDWAALRIRGGAIARGEINSLVNLCLAVNDRTPDVYLGKG